MGHTPFGHTGEEAFEPWFGRDGWHHAAQSVRIFEVLEDLNLTWEVRDGIRAHSWRIEPPPATPEALTVRYADRIAYLSHDALDALRAGVLTADELPARVVERFGEPGRAWIGEMIEAVIARSLATGRVEMDPETLAVMNELRSFMFERVYQAAAQRQQQVRAIRVLRELVEWHVAHPDHLPDTFRQPGASSLTQVIDYVAGMTDRYALRVHAELVGGDDGPVTAVPG